LQNGYTMRFLWLLLFSLCLTGCKDSNEPEVEYIYRLDDQQHIDLALKPKTPEPYPWQGSGLSKTYPITKEYFRCKGSSLSPQIVIRDGDKEIAIYNDCGGSDKHSLPLRNGKEYIYPVLIELLNRIQEITKQPVIITSGHRCPDHNTYVDPSPQNSASKHMIGAEVSFYVQGYESRPEVVVKIIQDYYKQDARYQLQKEFLEFKRFEKTTNTAIQPWYNKEVFIKVFKAHEGRNYDNRHAHPYISLQVRFDKERNMPVAFSWEAAQQFLRR
jgi:hypothetical protein